MKLTEQRKKEILDIIENIPQEKWDKLEKDIEKAQTKQCYIHGVSNFNCKKDPNIVKTYALITGKDVLTDVWCEGKCLGNGLDAD